MPLFQPFAASVPSTPVAVVPTTGQTVTLAPFTDPVLTLVLDPVGTLASLSIVLPAAIDGQAVRIVSSQVLTLLTLTAAAGAGTILGLVTTLAANGAVMYVWSAARGKWLKC